MVEADWRGYFKVTDREAALKKVLCGTVVRIFVAFFNLVLQ
jgi:hypothetical protein